MLRNWKIFCLVGLLIGLVFLSLIPTPPSKGQTGTLADIITAGVIQVGSDVAYPPFEDIDLDTGDVVGFDVDIMEELAAYISAEYDTTITVEFVASDWDPIIPNLQAEQFDVIMSAMTITSERELEVDFTRWYYQSAMGILVTTNNPKDIDHTDDLNSADVTIGVQTGTTTHIWLQDMGYDDVATVMTYDDFPLAIVALKQGNVDCVLGDVAVLNLDAVESGLTKVVYAWEGDEPERFGIACRTGDDDLRLALNAAIDNLLGTDEENPIITKTYNDIYKEWHGTDHSSYIPPTETLANILEVGKIRVGSDVAYPPFEDVDLDTGDVVGFDVDIMENLAAFMSAQYDTTIAVEFVASDWDPIIPNLQAQQFDVIMSAMTITSERELEVDFTRWYYQSAMGILVATDNPKDIDHTDDLNSADVTIGVQTGTTTHIWLQDMGYDDVATVMTYDDFPLAIVALKQGNVDCVLGDVAVLNLDAVESGLTKVVYAWEGAEPERFGIACRTGDDALRLALNAAIENLLGTDEESPIITKTYNEIYKEWHGTDHAGYIQPTETLAAILDAGKIRVGSDVAYPPFEDVDLDTGDVVGFDVDIMEELADHMSTQYATTIEVEFVASDWDPIIPNLQAQQFDVIMSAMTITSERELEVDFTRWYYQSAMGILVKTDNPKDIDHTDDLNSADVTIGVQTGTTTHIWLQDMGYDDVATVMTYDDFPLAIVALKQGNVDCVLGDVAVLNLDAVESGLTKVVYAWEGDEPERFGIACRTGDDALRLALNGGIESLLGTDVENPVISKAYNDIYKEWHGADAPGYVPPTTTTTPTDTDTDTTESTEEDTGLIPAFEVTVVTFVLAGTAIWLRRRRKL